jgi:hypothetical protein
MRKWLWLAAFLAGRPAVAQDMPLTQVLLPGEGWHAVEGKWRSVAALAADRGGDVYLVDTKGKQILRLPAGGGKAKVI